VIVTALIIRAAWVNLPRRGVPKPMDRRGLIALVCGLAMFVFAVMQGPEWGWSHLAIWIPFVGGIVALAVFVKVERRQPAPLIDVDLFCGDTVTACNLILFVAQFSKIAIYVFGALYLQDVLDMSPFAAGVALLAAVLPTPVANVFAGRATDRLGARWPSLSGMAFTTAAILWIGLAVDEKSYALLLPALLLRGMAQPFLFQPARYAIMTSVSKEEQGEAGGIAMTAQLLGGTIGMSICSTVFAVTGDFRAVFLTTGGIMLAVLVFGWYAIHGPATKPVVSPAA
jgi:predicted MFS family arabinose efflux permease